MSTTLNTEPIIYQLTELDVVSSELLNRFSDHSLFLLTGDLGAGKTTLVTAICNHLRIIDAVNSPTYSLVNVYMTEKGDEVYHMDLYRLKDEEEALDIGVEDYLYSSNYTFIEWPGIIEHMLPEEVVRIHIQNIGNATRKIVFL